MPGSKKKQVRSKTPALPGPGRPADWGPQWFLASLIAEPGRSVWDHSQQLGVELGLTARAIYSEVRRWRKMDPTFDRALIAMGHLPMKGAAPNTLDVTNWREDFCTAYRQHHNRRKAAEACGMSFSTVLQKLKAKGPEYDREFANMVANVDAEITEIARGGVRSGLDVLVEAVEDKGNKDNVKAADMLVRHGVAILERHEKDAWGKQPQQLVVSGTVFHMPVDARLNAVNKALAATQPAQLPAPQETVTVEFSEARAVAR